MNTDRWRAAKRQDREPSRRLLPPGKGIPQRLLDRVQEGVPSATRRVSGVFLSFVFLCASLSYQRAYKISETPFFCGVCHNMKVYVDSWKASTHRKVGCIECHYKPGFSNHLKGKWKDGQFSLVYFITGKSPTKPHAEIDDASCLQSGCHKTAGSEEGPWFSRTLFSTIPSTSSR